ncbi:MAG: Type secretion system pilin [Patescibacteria group bacterium]|nr:Type secretion system pilin [Patescibacteria group bacterium]
MKRLILILLVVSLFPIFAFGAGCEGLICNPIKYGTFGELFDAIIQWIIDIALVLAPLLIVYGGFLHITSAGDPAKSTQGKKVILYAAIGLIVALLARSLIGIIKEIVVI